MTDRELLEYAAKAAGIVGIKWHEDGEGGWLDGCGNPITWWNPLTDDGDALRLAVKLRLDICRPTADHDGVAVWLDHLSDFIEEHHREDAFAATRRAIVRAAAEIGKEMQ